MLGHSPLLLSRLRRTGLGDLTLLQVRVCTNDTMDYLEGVLVVLLCIFWNRIQ